MSHREVLPRRDRVRVASAIGADEGTVRTFLLGRRRTTPIIARAIREAMVALGTARFCRPRTTSSLETQRERPGRRCT